MRRLTLVLVFILAMSLVAIAQDAPFVEVSGGYSFLRAQTGSPTSFGAVNTSGIGAGVLVNFQKNVGLVGDFSHQFSTKTGTDFKLTSFMFGPQFTYRSGEARLSPFARLLVGAMHNSDNFVVGTPSDPGTAIAASTKWAYGFGGGVDAKLTSKISARVAQVDYIRSHFGNYHQNHFRLAMGFVVSLGSKAK